MKRKVRIKTHKDGDKLRYTPQIRINFLGFNFWVSIITTDEEIGYFWGEKYETKEQALDELSHYGRLSNEPLYYI